MSQNDDVTPDERLAAVVTRTMEGDLAEVRRVIEALPTTHPRRRLLLSNLRGVMALLQDMPGILAMPGAPVG